jgi:hypothetical protein
MQINSQPICTFSLSPESFSDDKLNLAGLLAYSLFVAFPSLLKQWLEEQTV